MNWLDIVILVILAIQTVTGFIQGLIRGALGLIGLIFGIILAGQFYLSLGEKLTFISNTDIANAAAFAMVLLAVWAVAALLGRLLSGLISATPLGLINRLGGAFFGLIIGAVSLGAMLAVWAKYFPGDVVVQSAMASFLVDKFPIVLGLLPSQFDSLRDFFN